MASEIPFAIVKPSWLSGSYYHVMCVNSDSECELGGPQCAILYDCVKISKIKCERGTISKDMDKG